MRNNKIAGNYYGVFYLCSPLLLFSKSGAAEKKHESLVVIYLVMVTIHFTLSLLSPDECILCVL